MPLSESKHFLVVLLLIFLGLIVLLISQFLAPVVIGTILAGAAAKFYEKLGSVLNKNVAALIAVILISLIIILPFVGLITLLSKEAVSLLTNENVFGSLQPLNDFFTKLSDALEFDVKLFIETQFAPAIKSLSLKISQYIAGFLSNFIRLALTFFVMLVTIFYMLRDGKKFATFLIELSPLKTKDELNLYKTFREAGQAVFYGNFITALVQGLFGGIGFAVFGLPTPAIWGAVMAFLALIPFLGPYIIFIPAAVYLFFTAPLWTVVIFLLYNILIVSAVDNLIKPALIGSKIKVHPLLIVVSILGGLNVFGLMGIIYGPLIAAIFLGLLRVYLGHHELIANNQHPI